MDDLGRPQGRYPEIFMLISLLEVCQEGGVNKGGVLGRQWGFLIRDMEERVIPDVMNDVFYPEEDTPKIYFDILIKSVSGRGFKKGGSGGRWGFLNWDMEDRVILDVIDYVILP